MVDAVSERATVPFQELLVWASDRPLWQRDALRRIVEQGELSEEDISILRKSIEASHGLSDEEPPELIPLDREHLSEVGSDAPKTVLASIGPVMHVDRLEPDQPPIKFAVNGITLIYGANGSGKSGYCRVAKQLCRSHAPDNLRGNIFESNPASPAQVNVAYRVGGEEERKTEFTWCSNDPAPEELARISVFDAASARVYVDKNRKIEYLPQELNLLNKLGHAVQSLDNVFKSRMDAVDSILSVPLPAGFREGTSVYGLLERLVVEIGENELPSEQDIRELADLSENEEEQINHLTELKNKHFIMAHMRQECVNALDTVKKDISGIIQNIGDTAVRSIIEKQNDVVQKEAVAKAAAGDLFRDEPLPDVGSETWRQMLIYAREVALEFFPDAEPPQIATSGFCVLCQQELDKPAKGRLTIFDRYLNERAAGEAINARRSFDKVVSEFLRIRIKSQDEVETSLSDYSKLSEARGVMYKIICKFYDQVKAYFENAKQILNDKDYEALRNMQDFPDSPLQHIIDDLEALANEIRHAHDKDEIQDLSKNLDELADRKKLKEDFRIIVDRQNKLVERQNLEKCRKICETRQITKRITIRRRELITPKLQQALEDELKALRLTHIPLKLNDRGERADSVVKITIDAPQRVANTSDILSEGEQRGLALAGFLAELQETGQGHGIIVDDPVSSLDEKRIEAVAQRLADEAKNGRQVIVFTHSVLFYHMLVEAARKARVACHEEWISSSGDGRFGIIDPAQKPRQMKNVSERIEDINCRLKKLIESGYNCQDQSSRSSIVDLYTQMRETWERTVEEILVNKAVQRFCPEIMTKRLDTACINPRDDYPKIFEGMKRCSRFSGHDHPAASPVELPEAGQIQKDFKDLKEFVDYAKERQRQFAKMNDYEKGVAPDFL